MGRLKAYQVDCYDTGSVIVFETNGAAARRSGGGELGLDFEEVESCRRKPEYDKYADTKEVPRRVLFNDGWRFECCHCGKRVDVYSDEVEPDQVIFDDSGFVYCHKTCQMAYYQSTLTEKKRIEAVIEWCSIKYPSAIYIEPSETYRGSRVHFKLPSSNGFYEQAVGSDTVNASTDDDADLFISMYGGKRK